MTKPVKLLWVGDAVVKTGFSRVTHALLGPLATKKTYEIDVLGITYTGVPHEYPYRIWPARGRGLEDLGYETIRSMVMGVRPDVLVLFNDPWVIRNWLVRLFLEKKEGTLQELTEAMANRPFKIIAYFPVDAEGLLPQWTEFLPLLDRVITYTKFGSRVLLTSGYEGPVHLVPHGIDLSKFFPIPREAARQALGSSLAKGDFLVLNGNRNQPRKRIDLTIKGFCRFAKDKPNAKLYLHMKPKDLGWDIIGLMKRECERVGIDINKRLILTRADRMPVSIQLLNQVYNSADVGLNTSLGEGWGLVSWEGSACQVPQIVPDFSAPQELYRNRGICLPVRQRITQVKIDTEGGLVREDDVAHALQVYYERPELREQHAQAMYAYVRQDQFRWENIAGQFEKHICAVLEDEEDGNVLPVSTPSQGAA